MSEKTKISWRDEPACEGKMTGVSLVDWILTLVYNGPIILALTKRDIDLRYRGSVFGYLWLVLNPLGLVLIYTYTFGVVMGGRFSPEGSLVQSSVSIYMGSILFQIFAEAFSRSPNILHDQAVFIKKISISPRIVPVIPLMTSIYAFTISFLVFVLVSVMTRTFYFEKIQYVPVILISYFMFIMGISWIFSAMGTFVRDIRHVSAFIVTGLLFFTPVFYPVTSIPEKYRWIQSINPLGFHITAMREVLLMNKAPSMEAMFMMFAVSYVTASIGYALYRKLQKEFADVV